MHSINYVNTLVVLINYPITNRTRMKNKYHLASVALIIAVLFSVISCSKDKIEPVGGSSADANRVSAARTIPEIQQFLDHDPVLTGALVMEIIPADAKAVVTVYNDLFTYGPVAANATEGLIHLDNMEPGIYNVLVKPINTQYAAQLITDVNIIEDTKTNLGKIILGY